jgi:hypothetical protein
LGSHHLATEYAKIPLPSNKTSNKQQARMKSVKR